MEEEDWPEVAVEQLKVALAIVAALAIDGWIQCKGECVKPEPKRFETVWSARQILKRWQGSGAEFFAAVPIGNSWGNIQPMAAASVTSDGDLWAGAGATYFRNFGKDDRNFVEYTMMPGVYKQGDGHYLGDRPVLRTAIGIGRRLKNGNEVSFFIDHRSNGFSGNGPNPGLETIGFNYYITTK